MFGFSLGISETYMTVLVKTLEVLWGWLLLLVCLMLSLFCLVKQMLDTNVLLFCSGRLWRCRRRKQMSSCLKCPHLMVSRMRGAASESSIVTDGVFDNHLVAQHLISSYIVLHVSTCCSGIFRSSRTRWCSCAIFNHSRVPLSLTLSLDNFIHIFIIQWLTVAVVAPVISQLLKSLCHTGCFSLSSYTIKKDCVSKTESLLSPKCARV